MRGREKRMCECACVCTCVRACVRARAACSSRARRRDSGRCQHVRLEWAATAHTVLFLGCNSSLCRNCVFVCVRCVALRCVAYRNHDGASAITQTLATKEATTAHIGMLTRGQKRSILGRGGRLSDASCEQHKSRRAATHASHALVLTALGRRRS
jgi:hypothetical protein